MCLHISKRVGDINMINLEWTSLSFICIFANFPEAELRPCPGGRGEVRGGDGCCVESVERLVVMFSCESGFSVATPSPHLTTNQITLRRPAHNRLGKCHRLTIFFIRRELQLMLSVLIISTIC